MTILVVSYNTREMTLECLRSIVRETTELPFEVLLVDNQSSDGSFEAVQEEFGNDSRFDLESSTDNLGFAGGNNHLAKRARGEYLLLLNPDTVVLDHAIERLMDFAESHRENGIWGGRTIFADGTLNPTSCWGPYTIWSQFCRYSGLTWVAPGSGLFNSRGYGGWARDSIREVEIVTGCFLMLKREDWESFGGFDPDFFMYGEEADLCMRARTRGLRPIVTPDATVIHHGGASEKVREDKLVRLLDAESRLLHRHWSPPRFAVAKILVRAGVLLRAAAVGLRNLFRSGSHPNLWANLWARRREWSRFEVPGDRGRGSMSPGSHSPGQ